MIQRLYNHLEQVGWIFLSSILAFANSKVSFLLSNQILLMNSILLCVVQIVLQNIRWTTQSLDQLTC